MHWKLTKTLLTDRDFILKPVLHRLLPVLLYSQNIPMTAFFLIAINVNGKRINQMIGSAFLHKKPIYLN